MYANIVRHELRRWSAAPLQWALASRIAIDTGGPTMTRRSKAEAAATRDSLLDAAEHVFFEKGYSRATLEDIARHAGVTRGALYWHFRDKADVLQAMLARVELPLEALVGELERVDANRPLATLRELCLHALRQLAHDGRRQRVYTILLHRMETTPQMHDHLHQMLTRGFPVLESLLERALTMGELAPHLSPRVVAYGLQSYLHGIYSNWLRAPDRFPLEVAMDGLLTIFFRGLAAPGYERQEEVRRPSVRG